MTPIARPAAPFRAVGVRVWRASQRRPITGRLCRGRSRRDTGMDLLAPEGSAGVRGAVREQAPWKNAQQPCRSSCAGMEASAPGGSAFPRPARPKSADALIIGSRRHALEPGVQRFPHPPHKENGFSDVRPGSVTVRDTESLRQRPDLAGRVPGPDPPCRRSADKPTCTPLRDGGAAGALRGGARHPM